MRLENEIDGYSIATIEYVLDCSASARLYETTIARVGSRDALYSLRCRTSEEALNQHNYAVAMVSSANWRCDHCGNVFYGQTICPCQTKGSESYEHSEA